MGFLNPTQPRRGCAAFGPGAIPRRALPTPPAPWRRPLAALVLAGSIGTMGMASQSAAAAEIDPSAGHRDAVTNESGEQKSAPATSTSQDTQKSDSDHAATPKRAAASDHERSEQSVPRRAHSESTQTSSDGGKSVSSPSSYSRKSSSSPKKKSSYNSKSSSSTTSSSSKKNSGSVSNKKRTGQSKSTGTTSNKKRTGYSKSTGTTSNKKRTGHSKSSYSGNIRSGNYSYTKSSSRSSSPSSSSSTRPAASSDAAAPSSTTTANGAAAPLAKGSYRIGAAFGATGSWSRYHTGQDFAASSGTPVYAVTSGTVISGNVGSWAGNYVVIRAADGSSTLYAHMSGTDVKVGQQVTAGQKIGNVGSTGRSFGAHLHFEYYPSGVTPGNVYSATNPMSYLRSIGISM